MRAIPRDHWGAFLLILLLGGVIYLNSLAASFQWDDVPHITRNPALYDWTDFGPIFRYWPSRFFLFWTLALNYRAGGLAPFGYHLFNALLHILSACLIYLIFFRLRRKKIEVNSTVYLPDNRLAVLAGLLFVAHPIQTQAVTYIIQRGAGLSGFSCLLSLYLYCRGRQGGSPFNYGGAWLAGLFGVFSKEGAAALPLLLGLWELLFGPGEGWRRKLKAWLPFAALPLIIAAVIWRTAGTGNSGFYYALNLQSSLPSVGLADSAARIFSRWVYAVTQVRVLLTYLRLLFLPVRQTVYYDFPVSQFVFQNAVPVSFLALLSVIIAAVRLLRSARIVSFGIFFFLISLLPTSSVIVLLPLVSEHHLYLALAGFAWAFPVILGRILPGRWFGIAGALIVLCLVLLTYARNLVWLTPFTLWRDALRKAPHLASLHDAMATVYIERGEYGAAVRESRKAFELDPGFNAHHNLWAAYHNLGRYSEAEEVARRMADLFPRDAGARQALALTLIERGATGEAEKELLAALELQPGLARPHFLLGRLYQRQGASGKAGDELRTAIRLAPYLIDSYDELGKVYEVLERWEEAEDVYRESLRVDRNHISARYRLVLLYRRLGQEDRARSEMEIIEKMIGDPELIELLRRKAEENG
ncbi:MAG: tetratricopeptide repeat protein [PVC group bacterium]